MLWAISYHATLLFLFSISWYLLKILMARTFTFFCHEARRILYYILTWLFYIKKLYISIWQNYFVYICIILMFHFRKHVPKFHCSTSLSTPYTEQIRKSLDYAHFSISLLKCLLISGSLISNLPHIIILYSYISLGELSFGESSIYWAWVTRLRPPELLPLKMPLLQFPAALRHLWFN
jgi:hypothetical protein